MLKNSEYYMQDLSQHFDYTLQYFEYDVDQGTVIGSNNIDCLKSNNDCDVTGKQQQAGILLIIKAENLTWVTNIEE